jgi:hypothetical protein
MQNILDNLGYIGVYAVVNLHNHKHSIGILLIWRAL